MGEREAENRMIMELRESNKEKKRFFPEKEKRMSGKFGLNMVGGEEYMLQYLDGDNQKIWVGRGEDCMKVDENSGNKESTDLN